MKTFFVYIMTNKWHTVLYTGVTAYIHIRGPQHKFKLVEGFTKQYNVTKMVFARYYPTALEAIAAEKRVKGWTRRKKVTLINSVNPEWKDLLTDAGEVDLSGLKDEGYGEDVLWPGKQGGPSHSYSEDGVFLRVQDDGLSKKLKPAK